MEGYKKYRLGDIADIIGGVSFSPKDICSNGIRILRGGNIQSQSIQLKTNDAFLPLSYKNSYNQVQIGDTVIVASTGSVEVLGKAATCFENIPNTQIGAFLRIIRPKHPKYAMLISIAINSSYFSHYIKSKAKGTSINNINLGHLINFEIPIASNVSLIHLSSFYQSIQQKICLNRAINHNLESLAKLIYDYWFVQFDFPDENGRPYKSSGGKMVWNEKLKREIPEGWDVVALQIIADIKNGATPSTKKAENYGGDIVWVTPKDLSDQKSKFVYQSKRKISLAGFDSCSTNMLPIGAVLLSSRAPIGLLSIAKTELCTNQGFKNIVPKNGIDTYFLYYYIKDHIPLIEQLGSGTTFKEVSRNDLCNFPVLLSTNKQIMKKWKEISNVISEKQFILMKETNSLTKLRDELLPLLMNGQVTVKDGL